MPLIFQPTHLSRPIPCTHVQTDEDGTLINNTEFCKLMYKELGTTMEGTGGYESSLNGGAESLIKTITHTNRAMLIGANLIDEFTCFSLQHSGTINNQMLCRMTGKVPAEVLTGKSILLKDLHPFGCPCKVLHKLPSKRTHSAEKLTLIKMPSTSSIPIKSHHSMALFLASVITTGSYILLVLWKGIGNKPDNVARVRHTIADHYGLSASSSDELAPNQQLLQMFHSSLFDSSRLVKWQVDLRQSSFDSVDSPFNPNTSSPSKLLYHHSVHQ